MIKKMGFCAEMTQKLLSGEKTKIIMSAPDYRECFRRVILDNRVYEVDEFSLSHTFCRLPIPLGSEVAIMRTFLEYYRDGKIAADGDSLEKFKASFGWTNRSSVALSDLKETFIASGVEIKRFEDVSDDEWREHGYAMAASEDKVATSVEEANGVEEANAETVEAASAASMPAGTSEPYEKQFQQEYNLKQLPNYVYVYNVRMVRL
jgi:hypothetical protein